MCAISTSTKEANQLFPLYLYPDATITARQQDVSREENFTQDFRNYIDNLYGKGKTPEQILGYIYAVLHSETYRTKYIEFLKDKFARIPFTKDKKVFEELSKVYPIFSTTTLQN
jgi:predicted helicase